MDNQVKFRVSKYTVLINDKEKKTNDIFSFLLCYTSNHMLCYKAKNKRNQCE